MNDEKAKVLVEFLNVNGSWLDVQIKNHKFSLNAEEYNVEENGQAYSYVLVRKEEELQNLIKEELMDKGLLKVKTMAEFDDYQVKNEEMENVYQYIGEKNGYQIYKKENNI